MRARSSYTNEIETVIPDGAFIYSRTDLKGRIEEANEAFAEISGYTREDMIGKPHNMVRHPDMPAEAFKDMWSDLVAGRPWRGLVKNRRSDGGYYWVVANASPVREGGRIVGYQSVRSRPTREEVAAAEAAYKRIREGDRSIKVYHGRVVANRPAWINAAVSLRAQMNAVGVLAVLQALLMVVEGFTAIEVPATLMALVAVPSLLYALYFLLIYAPHVQRDLGATAAWLENILTTGDLRHRFDLKRRDVIGALARRADKVVSSVQATLQGMTEVSVQVEHAAGQVGSRVHDVRLSAQTQSEAASSAAASIEEVTVSIGEVAAHAASTREVAEETSRVSDEGARITRDASRNIQSLADRVGVSAEQLETLGKRSDEIGRITGVIREIADQTNLLALNAAIEAARAGEQGRGFAVVADEVRKLAERTGQATREIGEMIDTIRSETQQAVDTMRAGATQVGEGVERVGAAEESLNRINAEMAVTMERVTEISHASGEQQVALQDLARHIEQVASMTEQNVAVVADTEDMVNRLEAVVDRMRKAVGQYAV
ncbi:methyl-accepting chemotaxis protein [Azoarcus olearius]|uniref:Aerotaxis receptor n=1 Tax=Azoarcus sp. (strain BH72) TaxID=418699 RepID=A1KCJ7_AZOSB|nr:PAS domain-containing methyl-accepting chemotaxis protein [Azoarcus olearius]CAL96553.1 putative aerotaxis receptor [Azoarcus olearius]